MLLVCLHIPLHAEFLRAIGGLSVMPCAERAVCAEQRDGTVPGIKQAIGGVSHRLHVRHGDLIHLAIGVPVAGEHQRIALVEHLAVLSHCMIGEDDPPVCGQIVRLSHRPCQAVLILAVGVYDDPVMMLPRADDDLIGQIRGEWLGEIEDGQSKQPGCAGFQ